MTSPTSDLEREVDAKARYVALAIIDSLEEWQAEAGQAAQVEQDYEAYEQCLFVKISKAIRDAFAKEGK